MRATLGAGLWVWALLGGPGAAGAEPPSTTRFPTRPAPVKAPATPAPVLDTTAAPADAEDDAEARDTADEKDEARPDGPGPGLPTNADGAAPAIPTAADEAAAAEAAAAAELAAEPGAVRGDPARGDGRTGTGRDASGRRRNARDTGFRARPDDESPGSILGGGLALGPGFLIHGLGHLYIGETSTAIQLFVTELLGIGLAVAGVLMEESADANGGLGGLRQGLLHTGAMLFVASWAADVLGAFKGAAALDDDTTRTEGSRFGLAYRYTDDPVAPFRHHIVLRLDLDTGWFFARPLVDLEATLALRQLQLDLGTRVFRGRNPQNRVIVGARLRRLENAAFGYAAAGVMGYVDGKVDLGQALRNLRNFYVFGRLGYGYDGLSFVDRTERVPNVFADAEFYDTYLVIQSGLGFNLGRRTHIEAAFVQDPTRDLRPFAGREGGLIDLSLTHRQSDNLDIEFVGTAGDAFGVWLGLGFGL